MGSEKWKSLKLNDVATVYDSLHKSPKYATTGTPMIRVTDLSQGFLKIEDTALVDDADFEEFSKKHKPSQGDIIFSRVGSYGIASYVNTKEKFCLGQNTVAIVAENIENKFLYYSLTSPKIKDQIEMMVTGSTQKTISLKSIRSFELSVPNRALQNKISSFLFSLDEKLELNNTIIKNIEQVAQALFKRWFIDFEFPNEDGEPYKSSGGEMLESEMGLIPKGWRVFKFTELVKSISESINKKEKSSAIFLNTSDILNGKVLKQEYSLTKEMPGQAKKLIQKDDILYSEIRPKNKRFAYIDFDAEDYVVSTKLMVLRTEKHLFSSKLMYLFLKSDEVVNELHSIAELRSGTFPQITFKQLDHYKFALPEKTLFLNLYDQLESLIDYQIRIFKENDYLTNLRDTLLPKLLSGEIELPDETEVVI